MLWWIVGSVGLAIVVAPFAIGPFLPSTYHTKTALQLDCHIEKAWDGLNDAMKVPMTGHMMQGVGKVSEKEWVEEIGQGERILVKTTLSKKPNKIIREMRSDMVNMTAKWEYTLEQVEVNRCRISIEGITRIENGTWHTPLFRFIFALTDSGKKGMDDHLHLLAKSVGA